MTAQNTTAFEIQRYLPESDANPRWQRFEIQTTPGMTVLQGLHLIREENDATLSWRHSCRMGICGSCAMVINGKPGLACNTQIHDVSDELIRLEPLWNFPIIKDLVADLRPMFDHHNRLKPYVIRSDMEQLSGHEAELEQTPAQLLEYMQFSYCIKCGACMAACPTVAMDDAFPGPMPLTAAHRYDADSRDEGYTVRAAILEEDQGAPHCHYAGECSRICPKGVDPAKAIQLMKRAAMKDMLGLGKSEVARPMEPVKEATNGGDDEYRAPEFTVTR